MCVRAQLPRIIIIIKSILPRAATRMYSETTRCEQVTRGGAPFQFVQLSRKGLITAAAAAECKASSS